MKNLLIIASLILTATFSVQADVVKGHFRGNGTYVSPHYRTPANSTVTDNLSYRGYTSQQPGYVSPRASGLSTPRSSTLPLPSSGSYGVRTLPRAYSTTPLSRR